MGLFESGEEFETLLGGFFQQVADTPAIAGKLLASKLIIRFTYTDPDSVLLIDCSDSTVQIRPGDRSTAADVDMSMTVDTAHRFWFRKVNLMQALTRKQMVAKGPIPKILALLPAIKPTYAMYPEYLKTNGYEKYVIY